MKRMLILLVLLAGCTRTDPVETMVDNHVNHINEVLEYTQTNFERNIQVKFLENELEICKGALEDVKQAYRAQISTCKARVDYWKLATLGLGILLSLGVFVMLKQWLKVI